MSVDEGQKAVANRYPLKKSLQQQFSIQKTNAHEWLYQRDDRYRALVQRVAELDEQDNRLYPNALASHKEFHNRIKALRKRLLAEDPAWKEALFAAGRAARAIDAFLITQQPKIADLPDSRGHKEIERLRRQCLNDPEYVSLAEQRDMAQQRLQQQYPELFQTDQEFTDRRKQQRKAAEQDPQFTKRMNERADAYRSQQAYLLKYDAELARIQSLLDAEK